MPKLKWDLVTKKEYETGSKQGVYYPVSNTGTYPQGYAWSGLTGVTESPSGAEATKLYADDQVYLTMRSAEEFGITITAYMYPPEFAQSDGSASPATGVTIGQQTRLPFGFVYRTVKGNDAQLDDYGYKLHLIYGLTASPSERAYATVNDSPEAIEFSWECESTPVSIIINDEPTNYRPTSVLIIDSTTVDATKLAALEDILFGTDGTGGSEGTVARLPLPGEVISLLS